MNLINGWVNIVKNNAISLREPLKSSESTRSNPVKLSMHRLLGTLLLVSLTACIPIKQEVVVEEPKPVEEPKFIPSTLPLEKVSSRDIRFAQTALKQLGYRIGYIDGLWGPRSQKAIQFFETSKNITSAGGELSEANLYALSKATKVRKSDIDVSISKTVSTDLKSKLDPKIPLSKSPQLIIVDKEYTVLAKANPYSAVVTKIRAGTGIYIVSKQAGWYEVESLDRKKGYILEN